MANGQSDGRVVFTVEPNNEKLKDDLKKTTKIIEDESKNWGASIATYFDSKMDGLIAKVAKLGEAFGRFIVQFVTEGIDLAQDVKDLDGTIDSLFGTSGAAKIDRWAKTCVKQFGMSELAAKKYAAKLGLVANQQGMTEDAAYDMTVALTGAAADLGSFIPGQSTQSAFDAIYAAITGTTTSLYKKFGIDLSDAKMKETNADFGKLTKEEKQMVRYSALMDALDQMGASGNFARSRGPEQNKQVAQAAAQNVQIQAGGIFTPVVEEFYDSAAKIGSALNDALFGKGVASREEINDKLALAEETLAGLNAFIENEAKTIGKQYGLSEEFYKMQGYQGSYGEWVMASLRQNQPWMEGEERQRVDQTLSDYEEVLQQINATETEIKSLQNDLATLDQIDAQAAEQAAAAAAAGVADGLSAGKVGIKREVDAILAEVQRLHNVGAGGTFTYIPGHAGGLDVVPRDNYLAFLHAGESVLNAQEAKVWRSLKYSGGVSATPDYAAWGATMRDNIRPGGNVYLDGQSVGRVISARQADSYRAMERSGFQQ